MRTALFSISYAGLWGQDRLTLDDFVGHAAALGFDAVMIAGKRPHLSPLDSSAERIDRLRASLAAAGLECAVVAAYTDFATAFASDVPVVEMQIGYVADLARLAADLGAGCVRVFTAYERPTEAVSQTWRNLVAALRECCDRAADCGVTIAIQNHHDLGVHVEAMLELLGDVDRANCRLGFDAWSQALIGVDLYKAARRAAPHTVLTTNADYVRLPRFRYAPELINYERQQPDLVRAVPFGEGFIDYAAFFRGLRDGGFNGTAAFEMCTPLRGGGQMDNLDRCARAYLEWMGRVG